MTCITINEVALQWFSVGLVIVTFSIVFILKYGDKHYKNTDKAE